jgi:hypothetical protein
MVEAEARCAKRLELRTNFPRQPAADPRQEEEPQAGAHQVAVEFAVTADEPGNLSGREHRAPVDQDEMQPDPQLRQAAGARHRVGRGRAADHQARRRQDAAPMRLLDRLVDRNVEPEIVGADDQAPQPAISRRRRN